MVHDMDGIMRRLSRLSSIIENDDDLLIEMGNEAHKWLKSLSSNAKNGRIDTLRGDIHRRIIDQQISKILPLDIIPIKPEAPKISFFDEIEKGEMIYEK